MFRYRVILAQLFLGFYRTFLSFNIFSYVINIHLALVLIRPSCTCKQILISGVNSRNTEIQSRNVCLYINSISLDTETGNLLANKPSQINFAMKILTFLYCISNSFDPGETVPLTGSVDAGWQKRGSGNAYNSLSGIYILTQKRNVRFIRFCIFWTSKVVRKKNTTKYFPNVWHT